MRLQKKVEHMAGMTGNLGGTLDELQGSIHKEMKAKDSLEKQKLTVEDLKIAQDTLADFERNKRDLEDTKARLRRQRRLLPFTWPRT